MIEKQHRIKYILFGGSSTQRRAGGIVVQKRHHDFASGLERSRIPEYELAEIATFKELQENGRKILDAVFDLFL